MGIKIVVVFGVEVIVIFCMNVKEVKVKVVGVKYFIASSDVEAMKNVAGSFDLIFDIVFVSYDSELYVVMFDKKGILCLFGL